MKHKFLILVVLVLFTGTKSFSQEETMGVIKLFAGTFTPRGYMSCEGQLLPINQYQALFSILGTTYGGDGITTFALPDLRGRIPVGYGSGPGLTTRSEGDKGGAENVTLLTSQMPAHTHIAVIKVNAKEEANTEDPTNNYIAGSGSVSYGTTPDIQMNSNSTQVTITPTGSSMPHENMQPYLGLRYIICVMGIYPTRD